MAVKLSYVFIFFSVLMISCSASKLGWKAENENVVKNENRKVVDDFDPVNLDDDDIMITPLRTESPVRDDRQMDDLKNPIKPAVTAEKELVQGFRVQLLATKDEINARDERKKALFILQGEDVYLEFESPYYKLRVGNCLTRKEAEDLVVKVKRIARQEKKTRRQEQKKGWEEWVNGLEEWELGAWIVRTKVEKDIEPN